MLNLIMWVCILLGWNINHSMLTSLNDRFVFWLTAGITPGYFCKWHTIKVRCFSFMLYFAFLLIYRVMFSNLSKIRVWATVSLSAVAYMILEHENNMNTVSKPAVTLTYIRANCKMFFNPWLMPLLKTICLKSWLYVKLSFLWVFCSCLI